MPGIEIRLVMHGKEVSLDSFIEAVVRQVRTSVREEMSRTLTGREEHKPDLPHETRTETPRQAVSIREAARLLSLSVRTVDKYIALKAIRSVRVGRRVLVPMKSVNEVAARGIPNRHKQDSIGEQ